MTSSRRVLVVGVSVLLLVLSAGAGRVPAIKAQDQAGQDPYVSQPVTPKVSQEVRRLPAAPPEQPGAPVREVPTRRGSITGMGDGTGEQTSDPLAQPGTRAAVGRTPDPIRSFDGMAATSGVTPPDTIGDVGPNHYVQMVNAKFAIYDKTGVQLQAPRNINQLWISASAGGLCQANNDGDPVVLYDPLADRWLLSQFAISATYAACIAISQTSDPAGAYYLYEFPVTDFPDYLKFGVWPDAYYMSTNEGAPVGGGTAQDGIFAFDRARMLSGLPATKQEFHVARNFMLPSDLDGPTPPPAGAPNYFYTIMDDVFWPSQGFPGVDRLEVWEFHVDWTTPANSTFIKTQELPTPFNYLICGFFNFNCVPQQGTSQKVDAFSEYPMWRLAYRNFGTHQALVGNFTVNVTGPVHAGIRWFELRKTGSGGWSIFQQGTHSPDNNYRWMGSAAMDRSGNIALGYSVSSSSLNPAIRYATRLYTETLGTLQDEVTLQAGGGVQTGSNRWGDYSAMNVDPSDGCTFWYTSEYYASTSATSWRTRIGAFKLPSCGISQLTVAKAPDNAAPQPGQQIAYTITISNGSLIDATNVTVGDILPAGLTFAGPVTLNPPSAGTVGVPPTLVSGLAIAAGQQVTITLPVRVNTGLAAGTVLTNTASIAGTAVAANTASAGITIANAPPLAGSDSITTPEGTPVTISVLANDSDANGDALIVSSVGTPSNGTTLISGTSIVYTPTNRFNGSDSFSYTVSDGSLIATATVTVIVTPTRSYIYLPMVIK